MSATAALADLSEAQLDLLTRHLRPIAANQTRLWIDHELDPQSNAYNVSRRLRLRGPLDAVALVRAVNELAARHEALRTVFLDRGDTVYQLVLDPQPVLTGVESAPADLDAACREFTVAPFDLRGEPPLRARLLRVRDDEYVLLLVFHHIAVDGWSLSLLDRELAEAYEAIARQGAWQQSAPGQYGDFTEWQQGHLTEEVRAAHLEHWRAALPPVPARAPIATPPLDVTERGHAEVSVIDVPQVCVAALSALCDHFGVSTFAALHAIVQATLWRYTGTSDIVLGTTTLNRKLPRFESAVGFFVNTVGLHADMSDNPSFATALTRAAAAVAGALSYDDVPFDQIVAAVAPGAAGPLFRVAIELQDAPAERAAWWGGVDLVAESLTDRRAKFDLSLFFLRADDGMRLLVEYDSTLVDRAWVGSLADAMFTLASAARLDPDAPVADLELLGDARRAELAAALTVSPPHDPMTPTSELIRALADHGDRVAVITESGTLTFAALVDRAERFATSLVDRGLEPGAFVGLVADRSVHSIAALFGIWLAQCAYVPIDPGLPADRQAHMIRDAGIDVVLGPAGFEPHGADLTDFTDPAAVHGSPSARRSTRLDDVAYAIFTSGTTGVPKATVIRHRNMLHFMAGLRETYLLSDWHDEVVSLNAPLIFDISVQQLLALLHGATVAIVPASARLDADAMIDYLVDNRVTVLECIPPHLQLLVDAGLLTAPNSRLRVLVTGGEALPPALWRPLGAAGRLRVYNVYGPTECTVNATVQRVHAGVPRPVIGRPLPGMSLFVADERGELVPRGAIGELYIVGPSVGAGYLGRPELTEARFCTVRWGPDGAAVRAYRTGDKVRVAQGDVIEYLGRLDDQVKVRGNRVELGEITARLHAHPAVARAVTVLDDADPLGPSLHAFIVAKEPVEEADLRHHARKFVPEYMVPARVTFLAAIPMTIIGKVDHRALAALCAERRTEMETVPPEVEAVDDAELRLVHLWREVLDSPHANARSNFFELGGHSLLAARLLARIRRDLAAKPTMADLLSNPTPRLFSTFLRAATTVSPVRGQVIEFTVAAADDAPVFFLHPLGGDIHVYQPLLAALAGKTVYGVFDGQTDPRARTTWSSATAMVDAYAADIAALTDTGGCHLIGWSLGGLLAHATAERLEQRGATVRSVSIWDAGISTRGQRAERPDFAAGALSVLRSMAPATDILSDVDERRLRALVPDVDPGTWLLDVAEDLWGARLDQEPRALTERSVVAALHTWLFSGWRPGVVAAPLHVTWAGDSLDRELITKTDWSRYTRAHVTERRVEATHFSIMLPPVINDMATNLAGIVEADAAASV